MNHDGGSVTLAPATTIATWPKGSFAENLAVDADGTVCVTLHTDRAVVRVDPATGRVDPLATFETPVAGLVFGPDALYVSGGRPGQAPGVIWRVTRDGAVTRAADLPDAPFLNGMALHPDGRLLVAESILGRVYAVEPATGAVSVLLDDPDLRPVEGDAATPGANGVKVHDGFVIVSVTGHDRIVRARLGADGTPGPVETLAEHLRADDFAVDADGTLYIATHPARSLVRLGPDGARATLAGPGEGMVGATAVAFGRGQSDRRSVYVTTTGGTMTLPDDQVEPAKLVRVDVDAAA